MSQRTICVVTATRAEYGLLRPVIRRLADDAGLRLQLAVTGAHLCARLGSCPSRRGCRSFWRRTASR